MLETTNSSLQKECIIKEEQNSSDDDNYNDGGSITSGKKLVRISSEYETINFTYGEDGKLTRASRNVNGNSEYINLDWSGNTITLTTHARWEENPCTITLDNGKISKATDGEETYKAAYSGNYLSQITGYNINKYTWENGNIVKYKVDNEGDIYNYTCTYYTDMPNKHSVFDVDAQRFDDAILAEYGNLLIMAHPTLFGLSNKNLLKSVTRNDGYTYSFTYELDSDGYPIKITETEKKNEHDSANPEVYTLTWEQNIITTYQIQANFFVHVEVGFIFANYP